MEIIYNIFIFISVLWTIISLIVLLILRSKRVRATIIAAFSDVLAKKLYNKLYGDK